jgi:hypothetical protein
MEYVLIFFLTFSLLIFSIFKLFKAFKLKEKKGIILNSIITLFFFFVSIIVMRIPSYTEITDEQYKIVFDTYLNDKTSKNTKEYIKKILSDNKVLITEYNGLMLLDDIIESSDKNYRFKGKIIRYLEIEYI